MVCADLVPELIVTLFPISVIVIKKDIPSGIKLLTRHFFLIILISHNFCPSPLSLSPRCLSPPLLLSLIQKPVATHRHATPPPATEARADSGEHVPLPIPLLSLSSVFYSFLCFYSVKLKRVMSQKVNHKNHRSMKQTNQ